jgi:hypothetical protein
MSLKKMKQTTQYKTNASAKNGKGHFEVNFSPSKAYAKNPYQRKPINASARWKISICTIGALGIWISMALILDQKLTFLAIPAALICGLSFRVATHQKANAIAAGITFFITGCIAAFGISLIFLIRKLSMSVADMISGFGFWSFTEALFDQIRTTDWLYLIAAGLVAGAVSGIKGHQRKKTPDILNKKK